MTQVLDGPQLTFAAINAALTGDNIIVPAVAGKSILVWKIMDVVGGVKNLTMKDGAGTNLTGAIPMVANGSMVLPFDAQPWFRTSPGNAFIINSSGATIQQSGLVGYTMGPSP